MNDDFRVGYGKPPPEHRFQPGQSGNPKGRPKGARGFKTELRAALDAPVRLTGSGGMRSITTQAAAIKRLVERAVGKGDLRAIEKLLGYAQLVEADSAPEPLTLEADDEALIADFLQRHGGSL